MNEPAARKVADSAAARAEELRVAGHALVDRMADYLSTVAARPVSTPHQPSVLAAGFAEPVPRVGRPPGEVWDDVWERVVGDAIHLHHPMYMGHQVAPPLPHAVLADALISLLNQSIAVWEMSPTGTMVEGQLVRWMIEMLGYPASADGTLVSGGSVANLTGLLAARQAVFPGLWREGPGDSDAGRAAIFTSGSAHYSVERSVGLLGLGSSSVIPVASSGASLDPTALRARIEEARSAGRVPMAVVATAGSTATGHFDDLAAIADVCADARVWLHVDAAHGASFLASPRLRGLLRGLERADSVAWDPHKMMFMPISLGAILIRDRRYLDVAFQQSAPYLFHPRPGEERVPDIGMRTLQCSKRFDALKLWICMRLYGLDHISRLQEATVEVAALLYRKLLEAPDFEPMHVPECNILCFRHLPAHRAGASVAGEDELQARIRARYNASGRGWITSTVLEGRRVLRVTIINPDTTEQHLDEMMDALRVAAE